MIEEKEDLTAKRVFRVQNEIREIEAILASKVPREIVEKKGIKESVVFKVKRVKRVTKEILVKMLTLLPFNKK